MENVEINNYDKNNIKKNKRRRKLGSLVKKFGCVRFNDDDSTTIEKSDGDRSFNISAASGGGKDHTAAPPSHLIVMVNGIIGSASNWRFGANQFVKAYPNDVIVHCSESNSNMLTFDGVDIMGKRLAEEINSIIKLNPNYKKISFISHSLGGLVSRYAIAKLYEKGEDENNYKIAGLEPVNFITVATPHLGSRGHKQVPLFCGFHTLEKLARHISFILGRTGKHLILNDSNNKKPPLLLQMANDTEDLQFLSALRVFKRRVAYANSRFDHLVGWSTSSLRRLNELPKLSKLSKHEKYKHIVNIEQAKTSSMQNDISTLDAVKRADMEEAMIRGLTSMSWERIDVNFGGSKQRFLAHSTIQVKTTRLYSDGADVIQHMVDEFML